MTTFFTFNFSILFLSFTSINYDHFGEWIPGNLRSVIFLSI